MIPIVNNILKFVDTCRSNSREWAFASSIGGNETLYASSFACMIYNCLNKIEELTTNEKADWIDYFNSWQDSQTGFYIGPEMKSSELKSKKHDYNHIAMHLTAHALPAVCILGGKPKYSLRFAYEYTKPDFLGHWLKNRQWKEAWLEGNNLLFVGQFLIYLRDHENCRDAQRALNMYFDFLDREVDPNTGLWGSNGFCSKAAALYGGYHQLLTYYYENRRVQYPEKLVDVALGLQHKDGGYNLAGGGGACEDVDAIDILVNMYKSNDYKRPQIRRSLKRVLRSILSKQMPDGGFVYKKNKPFVHMGIERTASGVNTSNMFPTWFYTHAMALVAEIISKKEVLDFNWKFNEAFSMGWHRTQEITKRKSGFVGLANEILQDHALATWFFLKAKVPDSFKRRLDYRKKLR
jgi:hypothetical protein